MANQNDLGKIFEPNLIALFTPFIESSNAKQFLASGTGSNLFLATSNASGCGFPFFTSGSDEQQTTNSN